MSDEMTVDELKAALALAEARHREALMDVAFWRASSMEWQRAAEQGLVNRTRPAKIDPTYGYVKRWRTGNRTNLRGSI